MKIIMVAPSFGEKLDYLVMEPLTMAVLAGLTPKDMDIRFYDDRIEDIQYEEDADLVAISVETFTAKRAYQIADKFRQKGIKVILGGFHPTLMPDEALEHADSIFIGEAEETWQDVISDLRNQKLKKVYTNKKRSNLVGIIPNRSIFKGKKYAPLSLVEFGRGCNFNCDFCSVNSFFGAKKITRPINDVLKDIKNSGKKYVLIVDDNLISNKEQAKDLFKALIPLHIKWISQVSIDFGADEELLNLAAKSGCFGVLIGFESLSKEDLSKMNKKVNINLLNYNKIIGRIHSKNIKICASFVFGYGDSSSFQNVLNFLIKNKILIALFNHLTPFPKTRLFEKLKSEKRLLYNKWWLEKDIKWGDVVFRPEQMTIEELYEGCRDLRMKFFSIKSIFKRLWSKANISDPILYLAINYLVRKSIRKKQGFLLGAKNAN